VDEWLRNKIRARDRKLRAEWADEIGHDHHWWREQAKRTKTDWSSLLRQRIRMVWWVRAGRPSLQVFSKVINKPDRRGGNLVG